MKPLHIPAAVLSIYTEGAEPCYQGTLVDSARRAVVAADGKLCVVRPFPDGVHFARNAMIPHGNEPVDFVGSTGDSPEPPEWGWENLKPSSSPDYRIRLDARKLASLAAAMDTDEVIIELPPSLTSEDIIHVLRPDPLPDGTRPYGFLAHSGGEGPLSGSLVPSGFQTPPPAPDTAPDAAEIRFNAAKGGIELAFPKDPGAETRQTMDNAGFRWHRMKKIWYARDTQVRRDFALELLRSLGCPPPAAMPPLPLKQVA